MNLRLIVQLSLPIIMFLTGSGNCQTDKQIQPKSFSLLYSSNVSGEYEPCG
jgi:hypothetical protein